MTWSSDVIDAIRADEATSYAQLIDNLEIERLAAMRDELVGRIAMEFQKEGLRREQYPEVQRRARQLHSAILDRFPLPRLCVEGSVRLALGETDVFDQMDEHIVLQMLAHVAAALEES